MLYCDYYPQIAIYLQRLLLLLLLLQHFVIIVTFYLTLLSGSDKKAWLHVFMESGLDGKFSNSW